MKPIPTAIPRAATTLSNAVVNSPVRVGLSTDVQGADPQALEKFSQALPKHRGAANKLAGRKLPWEDEIMAAREEVLADAQEWQMAQAEVTGAGAGAGGSIGGAAGGAAGAAEAGGAAGAAGAGGAGAAAAAAGVSPLGFAPALALGGGGGGSPFINTPPVLTLPAEARLAINGIGDVQCAKASSSDVDGQVRSYFFLENGQRVSSVEAYSKAAEGQDAVLLGEFSIDPVSGQISFQYAEGANEALMCDEATLTVVAFDGIAQSAPGSITIEWAFDVDSIAERVLDDVQLYRTPGEEGAPPLSDFLKELKGEVEKYVAEELGYECPDNLDVYARSEVLTVREPLQGRYSGSQLIQAALVPENLDDGVSMVGFKAFRDQAGLTMGWAHLVESGSEGPLDAYLAEVTLSDYSNWSQTGGFAYVHFEKPIDEPDYFYQGSFFASYDLGQKDVGDDHYDAPCADAQTPLEQEHGVYRVSKSAEGTECNDLIAGALGQFETLNGGAGNDLIFAQGDEIDDTYFGDTVRGGFGDDLIVLSGEGHTVQFEANQATNGTDVVVGFECGSKLAFFDGAKQLALIEGENLFIGDVGPADGFNGYAFVQVAESCDWVLTHWNGDVQEQLAIFVNVEGGHTAFSNAVIVA